MLGHRLSAGVLLERHLPRLDLSLGGGPTLGLLTQRIDYLDFVEDDNIDH